MERKFTPPFLVQMCSGEKNEQCDKYPHGSFHEVKKDEEGRLWVTKGIDSIPSDFKTKIIDVKPETKNCPKCSSEYPKTWPFAKYGVETPGQHIITESEECCVRCYERHNIGHKPGFTRDDYRQVVREELKLEGIL